VDEVSAVGDSSFQKKCLAKIASYAKAGRTVYREHNPDAVRTLCQRGIWLKMASYRDGKADEIIEDYSMTSPSRNAKSLSNTEHGLSIQKFC